MVSYYNPVAMLSRTGSGHHHQYHHSSPTSNPYFPHNYPGYPHPHHAHHQGGGANSAVGVSSTQFSPNMAPDFNCNHQYPNHFGHMTPTDTALAAAAAPWNHPSAVYSACHRNLTSGYEEWSHQHGHHPLHTNFYSHQQPSTPSSSPSPNSSQQTIVAVGSHNGNHSPSSNVYSTNTTFKTEFGPCSGGNPQENSSQEMQTQGPVVSSAGPSIGTPHSPDSGMAISDGVSSSGSPATGIGGQHCLGGGGAHHLTSSVANLNGSMIGSQQNSNLNQQSLHTQRPAQARSPFEWMKKPAYSVPSNNNDLQSLNELKVTGSRKIYLNNNELYLSSTSLRKTRTKDKYRVVYSDTQRLELEKEFHFSRYITIRRKSELATMLGLSERQVKIWFQNRRAKERKVVRKREEMIHREKIATMAHMQNAVAAASGGMLSVNGPMCNQGNGTSIPSLMQ
ncbi:unnamed protein product [Allacma fusca]|uniref:Homeobox domain-containing protein n=1 Tax=Allacma fusca TaxID=39272 RepID=A0A8J2KHY2_9HEXA|nr:unnamed protein product [Allacma fusca]